jgi:hypothetical protein
VSPPDPVAGCELANRALSRARAAFVLRSSLDSGGLPEIGKLEPRDEPPAFALDGLAIDQEADLLLEHERSNHRPCGRRSLWPPLGRRSGGLPATGFDG